MSLDLRFHPQALRGLRRIPPKHHRQITSKIFELMDNCQPHDYRHLAGCPGSFRVTVGEYRVVYQFTDETVCVQTIGPKNDDDAYKTAARRR